MLQKIFFALMELNITMSCVILILLTFSLCCGKRFTAHCRYVLWIAAILRLCFPVSMPYLPALWEIQLPERVVQQEYDIMLTEPETSGTPETFLSEGQPGGNENVPDNAANRETITEPETDRIQSELPLRKVRISPVNGLAVIWAAGAFLLFTVRITGYLIVSSRLRYTRTLPQKKQTDLCRRLGEKLGLQAAALPALYITREVHSPMLCGFLRPVVLLPDITLTDNQLTGILAHELIHRKRCDLWIKLICAVVVSLHWFNPLVYIAAGKCCREMELSCDERVLAGKDEAVRLTYGKVMLDIIRRCRRPVSGLTTHFNPGKSAVRERFESILDGTGKFRGLWLCGLVVLLCAAAGSMVAFGKADLPADNEPMPEAVVNNRTDISDTKITYYTIPMTSGEQYTCFQGKLTEYFPTHYGDIDLSVLAEQKMPVPVNSEAAPETLFAENRSSYLGSHSDVFVVTGTLLQGEDRSMHMFSAVERMYGQLPHCRLLQALSAKVLFCGAFLIPADLVGIWDFWPMMVLYAFSAVMMAVCGKAEMTHFFRQKTPGWCSSPSIPVWAGIHYVSCLMRRNGKRNRYGSVLTGE
ncbi:MAG: M56 family metallopeptidase [Ruminococcaceae bacterium]|nr:M56 family metallopeptidase [Oscillospiraceae bacterium]